MFLWENAQNIYLNVYLMVIYIYMPLLSHVHPCLHPVPAALLSHWVIFPSDEALYGSKLS